MQPTSAHARSMPLCNFIVIKFSPNTAGTQANRTPGWASSVTPEKYVEGP